MADTDDMNQTADELRKSVNAGAASNVDDILEEIIGGDGAYSLEYHDMFTKYNAQSAGRQEEESTGRIGGRRPHRDYGAEADAAIAADKKVENNISRKVAPSVRDTVARESKDTVRPEFTAGGGVRYPTYGVGESGERVVYDADWEEEAKEEAARINQRTGTVPSPDAPTGQFRFTGADEAPKRRTPDKDTRADDKKTVSPRASQPPEEAPAQDVSFFPEDFSSYRPAQTPAPQPAQTPAPAPENRGLSPEAQQTVDNAVLEAFSSDFDSDEAFKARWKDTVEKAQRRKEQKAKQAQEEEARQRSLKKLEEQERKVAQMEETMEINPPPAQKGTFTVPPETVPQAKDVEIPAAERLETPVPETPSTGVLPDESTIKKSAGEKFGFFMKTHFSKEGFKRFAHNNLPCKGDSGREIFRKIVMDVSFVALVCGLVYLAIYYHNYRARNNFDDEVATDIGEFPSMNEQELEDAWAELKAMYPDVVFPEGMDIKFAKYYAMNSDTVGYLSIAETPEEGSTQKNYRLQTVLVQSKSTDYYLYRDFYKKYSRYGSPFVMSSCNMGKGTLSKNTVIYGHNTHDHMIFNTLEEYMKVSGYLSAPIITMDTLYETTKWKIFAVMLTNADPEDDNGYVFDYLYSSFSSDSAFLSKMNQIKARSMIHTGVDVQAGDRTLMLYTCYRTIFNSGRLVIVARQLREGESEEINTSQVYYDSSAIFPAAYYTGTPTKATETEAPETEPDGNDVSGTEEVLTDAPLPGPEDLTDAVVDENGGETPGGEDPGSVTDGAPEEAPGGENDAGGEGTAP